MHKRTKEQISFFQKYTLFKEYLKICFLGNIIISIFLVRLWFRLLEICECLWEADWMFVTWTKNTISRADSISSFLPPDQPRVLLYLFVSPGGFFPVLPSFRMVTDDRAMRRVNLNGTSWWCYIHFLGKNYHLVMHFPSSSNPFTRWSSIPGVFFF